MTECAVLLCAGTGTRLLPLTSDRPKCLVDVGGETILLRAVRLLLGVGVRQLVVATGYRREAVETALADIRARVTFCHNPDFERTQNSVSLALCANVLREKAFFKLDGDVLFDDEILSRLERDASPLSVAVERRGDLGAEEMKVITEGTSIRSFGKNLLPALSSGESIGIERISATSSGALFDALARAVAAGRTDLYYEDVYNELIAEGLPVRAVDVTDVPWIEVDTPEDLERARRWASSRRSR